MRRGMSNARKAFVVVFVAYLLLCVVAMAMGLFVRGDWDLFVLYASFPLSGLAHGLSTTLVNAVGVSRPVADVAEVFAGGVLGAIQYGLIAGLLTAMVVGVRTALAAILRK